MYYYYHEGQKQGPCSSEQLRQLVQRGIVVPETVIETEDGRTAPARKIKGLFESEASQSGILSGIVPPPLPSRPLPPNQPGGEVNPFTKPRPDEQNPFTAPMPGGGKTSAPSATVPWDWMPIRKFCVRAVQIILGLLLLAAVVGIGWPLLSESNKLQKTAQQLVEEELANRPFEIVDISIDWTAKPANLDVVKSFWRNMVGSKVKPKAAAAGKMTVKAQTKEKFYVPSDFKDGLKELGVTELYDDKYNLALEKFRTLPVAHRGDLRMPVLEDPSRFRFYKMLTPQGEEVTLTGTVTLNKKDSKNQLTDDIQIDPLYDVVYTQESQLKEVHKLDDPATKKAVNAIVEGRTDFITHVDAVHAEWKFNEIWYEGLRKTILGKPLEISTYSVDWKTKTGSAASGKFSVKARTTEKLYQSVDNKATLEKWGTVKRHEKTVRDLGIAGIFEKEVYEGDSLSIPHEFYEVALPKDSEVSLTGDITMSKSERGPWQLDGVQVNSINPSLEGYTLESKSQGLHKLDDTKTKETVEASVKDLVEWLDALIQQRDDFDKFCKGRKYKGILKFQGVTKMVNFGVNVVFEDSASQTDRVSGTIGIPTPGWKGSRNFTVAFSPASVNRNQTSVSGTIDNGPTWPTWEQFRDNAKATITSLDEAKSALQFYNLLTSNVKIDIQFTNHGMEFSLADRNGGNGTAIDLTLDGNASVQDTLAKDRSWVEAAIKRRPRPELRAKTDVPAAGGRQTPTLGTGVLDLYAEIHKSGFSDYNILDRFVQYSSKRLEDRLNEETSSYNRADAFDKAAAQKKVDEVQAEIRRTQLEIARATFVCDYVYSTSDVTVHGDRTNCTIEIRTGFDRVQGRVGMVSLPISNVACGPVTIKPIWYSIIFPINGSTDSIQELVRNHALYRARIQFRNLRYENNGSQAELLKIDIIKLRE